MGTIALRGNKSLGGGSDTQTNTPDTLKSDDSVEIVLALSEGPCVGFANGARSFFVGGTPLVDTDNKPNIGNFDLRLYTGDSPATPIVPKLGGFGASTNVGVELETHIPVTRSGTYSNIDFLELRIVYNRLLATNKNGTFAASGAFIVEIKPHSSSVWQSAYTTTSPPPYQQLGTDVFQWMAYAANNQKNNSVNPAFRKIYLQSVMPGVPEIPQAVWLNSSENYRPYGWNLVTWAAYGGATHNVTPGYSYWEWNDGGIVRRVYHGFVDGAAPAPLTQYDFWVAPTGTMGRSTEVAYTWNGSAWVDYMDWAQPPITTPGIVEIYGKTSVPYVKELRFAVPRISEPFDVRVTKLSLPNTTEYFCDILFESFQELTANPVVYDDLMLAHLTIKASNQFSSVPEFLSECKGRIIRVPNNYNPDARTYTGIWDGTFKFAYSNNLAWCAYDLVTNARYGVASYRQVIADKFAFYAFGQHCDAHGFTYNDWITEPRNLNEMIDYVCGIGGGKYIDRGDGYATVIFDYKDQPAEHLFTPENVGEGIFTYAFTDITSRKNDITVSFKNELYGWIEDRRRIYDQTHIDTYGRNPEEFVAVGCTDETEAVKRARLRLATSLTEKTIVTFKTNRQGLYVNLYGIILVADPDSGFGLSGRINSVVNSTTLALRDPLYFEAGFTYKVKFSVPDGGKFRIIEHNLITSTGSTKQLKLATPLAYTLPEYCTFSIESSSGIGAPKAWRVTDIEEVDGDPDNVSISALEVNRNKWDYVDGIYDPIEPIGTGNVNTQLLPPTDVRITPRTTDGKHYIDITWTPSGSPLTRQTRLYQQINGGDLDLLTETRQNQYTIVAPVPAKYQFALVTVGLDGNESPPVRFEHIVAGDESVRLVTAPTNLRIQNSLSAGVFTGRDPVFLWDASVNDPYVVRYRIQVQDPADSSVKRQEFVTDTTWTYSYGLNEIDWGTPKRNFNVEVRAVDAAGFVSPRNLLLCSNPLPVAPLAADVSVTQGMFMAYVSAQRPASSDIAGMAVYASTTNGFTPSPTTLIYKGPDITVRREIAEGQTLYFRVAFYDTFDGTLSPFSDQKSVVGSGLVPNSVSYTKLSTDLQTEISTIAPTAVRVAALEEETYGTWNVRIQTQVTTNAGPKNIISGFGLAQATHDGVVESDFIVQADRFSIIPSYNSTNPVKLSPVFVASTVAGNMSVGINGDLFLDGSISANALKINSQMANLVVNGDFEADLLNWSAQFPARTTISVDSASGSKAVRLDRTAATTGINGMRIDYTQLIPVAAGVPLEVSAMVKGDTASIGGCYLAVLWYDGSLTLLNESQPVSNQPFTTTYALKSGQTTPPASAKFAKVRVYHWEQSTTRYMYADNVALRGTAQGTSIQGGAISAYHLSVTSLSSITGNVGILTAGIIQGADPNALYMDLNASYLRARNGDFQGTLRATKMVAGSRLELGAGANIESGVLPFDTGTYRRGGEFYFSSGSSLNPNFTLKRDRLVSDALGERMHTPIMPWNHALQYPAVLDGGAGIPSLFIMPDGGFAQTGGISAWPSGAGNMGEVHQIYWDPGLRWNRQGNFWALGRPFYIQVPAGVTAMEAWLWGGGGGTCWSGNDAGAGGHVRGYFSVTEGQRFHLTVGFGGSAGDCRESDFTPSPLRFDVLKTLEGWAEAGRGEPGNLYHATGGGRTCLGRIIDDAGNFEEILVAGGGGAGHAGQNGTPGGPYSPGWTGGMPNSVGQNTFGQGAGAGGGGGGSSVYGGGGTNGKGGSNYVHPSCWNTSSQSGSGPNPPETASGYYNHHCNGRMGFDNVNRKKQPGYGFAGGRRPNGPTVLGEDALNAGAPGFAWIGFW
ncbi:MULTISPECIES: DUF1983 domain-containing protein [unclassified Beijerinckia]|uniref:phage tail tip fiber protein n=1 Tax=unclassified Beijerinckia TaxID=2638183 RepID=UPI0008982DF1|nr:MULTISPECIES: DUF1983 domain-containing protein [unclassified Beijerinckia]MDH7796441.1 hypothetical protein [Beijerinckia sp. GAS462]SEC45255.1 protein of unknown function [Beijerinckia sp. 28-YEA-48]